MHDNREEPSVEGQGDELDRGTETAREKDETDRETIDERAQDDEIARPPSDRSPLT